MLSCVHTQDSKKLAIFLKADPTAILIMPGEILGMVLTAQVPAAATLAHFHQEKSQTKLNQQHFKIQETTPVIKSSPSHNSSTSLIS